MADFGYDISDFLDIDPIFGTIEDFSQLTAAAKAKSTFNFIKLSTNADRRMLLVRLENCFGHCSQPFQ